MQLYLQELESVGVLKGTGQVHLYKDTLYTGEVNIFTVKPKEKIYV